MITESFHEYKGYTVRLRAVTNNGFWYTILKQKPNASSPNGIKNVYLRKIGFHFIEPKVLLKKAFDYIDNFEQQLIDKYNKS